MRPRTYQIKMPMCVRLNSGTQVHYPSELTNTLDLAGISFAVGCPRAELVSYTKVADKHARLPEGLRQRLDAVFAGLAQRADPNTSYEEQFIGIETEWHQRMRTATSRSWAAQKNDYS